MTVLNPQNMYLSVRHFYSLPYFIETHSLKAAIQKLLQRLKESYHNELHQNFTYYLHQSCSNLYRKQGGEESCVVWAFIFFSCLN